MNCKQGDRAMIVRLGPRSDYGSLDWEIANAILGRVVICAQFYINGRWPSWHFEEPIRLPMLGGIATVAGMADACLMPLRDADPDTAIERTEELTA